MHSETRGFNGTHTPMATDSRPFTNGQNTDVFSMTVDQRQGVQPSAVFSQSGIVDKTVIE
jgi:hypothetical protein